MFGSKLIAYNNTRENNVNSPEKGFIVITVAGY